VRESYLGIAEREPQRFIVIDASRSIDEIHADALKIVLGLLQ
jgi:thymidylate kinase